MARLPVFLVSLVCAAPAYAKQGTETNARPSFDQQSYPHPQQLVRIAANRRTNFYCTGSGSPTVVMDAGFGDTSIVWGYVQPTVPQTTKVCSSDRAGEGFSDRGQFPRTSAAVVDDLHALLQSAGVPPPYPLVGHSWGGLNVVLYASLFFDELAGMVLVNPTVADQEIDLSEIGPTTRDGNRQQVHAYRNCADLARKGLLDDSARREQENCSALQQPSLDAAVLQITEERETRPTAWATIASEHDNFAVVKGPSGLYTDSKQARAAGRSFEPLPLIATQAGTAPSDDASQSEMFLRARERQLDSLAKLTTRGERVLVPNAGHYIHTQQPDVVIEAIPTIICVARGQPGTTIDACALGVS